jgi:uncharacterized phage protein gp47/JayE
MQPWIDYTNKDFESLVKAMQELAQERLPVWTDQSPNDLGVLLMELFAYMGDIILYYQDRIANESFLHTARERRSILYLLRLIGYELLPATSASADLTLIFKKPEGEAPKVTISPGAQFATKKTSASEAIIFEYIGPGPVTIDLGTLPAADSPDRLRYASLPVRHSESKADNPLGSSTGEPNQSFQLKYHPVLLESLQVFVLEGDTWVGWTRRENLLYYVTDTGEIDISGAEDRHYYVQVDENDAAWVVFGDGVYGRIPPKGTDNIRAEYRVGGGQKGNVAKGTITDIKSKIENLEEVSNPYPAVGGADRESLDHARQFAPLKFRSGDRAVTINDFIALAHSYGGVAKAYAESFGWNTVYLYIAPEAPEDQPAPADLQPSPDLRRRLVQFFQDKKMIGTEVRIRPPQMVPIDIEIDATAHFNFYKIDVERQIREAAEGLLAYGHVDFAGNVYLSKFYEAVEAIPGVDFANIPTFRRQDAPATVRMEPDGRIEIGAAEIPTRGLLTIQVQGGIEGEVT